MGNSASEILIYWSYLIISLGLILSPFFILWKKKLIKWRWIFSAYFLSIAIFAGIFCLDNWYDRYLYNNVYNSGWLMEVMLEGFFAISLLFMLFLAISPFLITKLKYKKFSIKRVVLSLVISSLIGGALFGGSLYYMGWAMTQAGWLYF